MKNNYKDDTFWRPDEIPRDNGSFKMTFTLKKPYNELQLEDFFSLLGIGVKHPIHFHIGLSLLVSLSLSSSHPLSLSLGLSLSLSLSPSP